MEASMSPRAPQKCRARGPSPDPAFSQAPRWAESFPRGPVAQVDSQALCWGDRPPGALGTLWRQFRLFYMLGWGWVLLESIG